MGRIDCCACRNCCREVTRVLVEHDILRLAKGLGITTDDFVFRLIRVVQNYSVCPIVFNIRGTQVNFCEYEKQIDQLVYQLYYLTE